MAAGGGEDASVLDESGVVGVAGVAGRGESGLTKPRESLVGGAVGRANGEEATEQFNQGLKWR